MIVESGYDSSSGKEECNEFVLHGYTNLCRCWLSRELCVAGSPTRSIGRVEFGNCKRSIRTALKTLRKGVLFAIQECSCYHKNIDFTKPHETYNFHMRIENSWKIGCKGENDVGLKIYGFILTSMRKLACRLLHYGVIWFVGIVKYAGKYFKRYDLTLCFFKLFFLD